MPIGTVDDVKQFLRKEGNAEDGVLQLLLDGVSEQLEGEIGSAIAPVQLTEYAQTRALMGLVMRNAVIEILSVTEGVTSLTTSQYRIDGRILERLSTDGYAMPWPSNEVAVVYRAGFQPIPADLKMAAVVQTAFGYRQTKGGGDRLGLAANSPSEGGEAVSFVAYDLLPDVARTTRRYRSFY